MALTWIKLMGWNVNGFHKAGGGITNAQQNRVGWLT